MKRKKITLQIPGKQGRIPCFCSTPVEGNGYPLVLYFHGGGFSMGGGSLISKTPIGRALKRYPFVLLSPSYALMKGPGQGYPRQFDDCYATLEYALAHEKELHFDKSKIIIAGDSAGGNLAVAVTFKAIDNKIPILAHIPLYPMLSAEETSTNFSANTHIWNGEKNRKAWAYYLSGLQSDIPDYASPSIRKDLKGMPPCYTFVSDLEPFYQETMDYIEKLREAGVEASVDVFHANSHGFDLLYPFTKNARAAVKAYFAHLEDFLSR